MTPQTGTRHNIGRSTRLRTLTALLLPAVLGLGFVISPAAQPPAAAPATQTPAKPKPVALADRWKSEMAAFDKENEMHPPRTGGLVFCGSSTIRLWKLKKSFPELAPLNRGFGGSRFDDLVVHAERILKPLQPAVLVVYSGDNDIAANQTTDEVCKNFEAFHAWVRKELPRTKVIVLGIKPSIKRWAMIESIRETNGRIAQLCGKDPLSTFIDTETVMLGGDGQPIRDLYVEDGLHMSQAGYDRWAALLSPYLDAIYDPNPSQESPSEAPLK